MNHERNKSVHQHGGIMTNGYLGARLAVCSRRSKLRLLQVNCNSCMYQQTVLLFAMFQLHWSTQGICSTQA